jgi:hypothetical protein
MALTKNVLAQLDQFNVVHMEMLDALGRADMPEGIADIYFETLQEVYPRCHGPILERLAGIADHIYRMEGYRERPDDKIDWVADPVLLIGYSGAQLREAMWRYIERVNAFPDIYPIILAGVRRAVEHFIAHLPAWLREFHGSAQAELQTPLINVLPQPGSCVGALIDPFLAPEAKQRGIYVKLSERLTANIAVAGGRAKTMPATSSLQPMQLVQAYLKDTPFLALFTLPVPVEL